MAYTLRKEKLGLLREPETNAGTDFPRDGVKVCARALLGEKVEWLRTR